MGTSLRVEWRSEVIDIVHLPALQSVQWDLCLTGSHTGLSFLYPQILADPVGQTDGAMRIDDRYEGTGGANHQQN
jgi:hypothetical protein